MGLGTKIKDALSGDKEHHHSTTDTSKTPGSYPSEEVPRSHARNDTHNSNVLSSTSEPRTDNLSGKKSSEYTYGSKAGTTGHHSHNVTGQHDTGLAHKGAAGTTGTSTGNKFGKENTDPYWGSSERSAVNEPSFETGTHGRVGNDLHAHDVNERYNQTSPRDDLTHTGTTGLSSDRNDRLTGASTSTTGGYGSQSTSEGVHGPHSSRVANAADPRVDSDRDHRGAVGSSTLGSSTHGTYGDSGRDYDHHNTPGSAQTSTTTTTGTTSNLTHRPFDSGNNRREYKINEYDAPTSSSDRDHGNGNLAGAGAGAAAGYGASKLADRHHEHDMREKDPYSTGQYGDRHRNDHLTSGTTGSAGAYGSHNTAEGVHGPHSSRIANAADPRVDSDRDHRGSPATRDFGTGAGTSMLDPHASNTATKPGTGAGTSMLDPYGSSSGNTAGNRLGATTGTALGSGSHGRDTYPERQDYNSSSAIGTGSNIPGTYDQRHNASTGSHLPSHGQSHNLTQGTGSGFNNTDSYGQGYGTGLADTLGKHSTTHSSNYGPGETRGSSEYSNETGAADSDHLGPGHHAAKVMHKCHNCGADNDISQHFRKGAVYRMG